MTQPTQHLLLSQCDPSAIKVILFIINNIINHLEQPKYHSISIYRLSKKLNDPQFVINILIDTGFEKYQNGTRIKFNMSNINKLRALQVAIHEVSIKKSYSDSNENIFVISKPTTNKIDVSNNSDDPDIPLISIRRRRRRKIMITCICHNVLTETTPKIYGNDHQVLCDECFEEIEENHIMFHCDKGRTAPQHKYGYDLCENCGLKKKDRYHDEHSLINNDNQTDDEPDDDHYDLSRALHKFNISQIDNNNDNNNNNDNAATKSNQYHPKHRGNKKLLLLYTMILIIAYKRIQQRLFEIYQHRTCLSEHYLLSKLIDNIKKLQVWTDLISIGLLTQFDV